MNGTLYITVSNDVNQIYFLVRLVQKYPLMFSIQ